jgi:hypothetical protein
MKTKYYISNHKVYQVYVYEKEVRFIDITVEDVNYTFAESALPEELFDTYEEAEKHLNKKI